MKKWILAAGLLTCASLVVVMRGEAKQLTLADIQRECEKALRANTVEALQYFLLRYPNNGAYRHEVACYAVAEAPSNITSTHDEHTFTDGSSNSSSNSSSDNGDNGTRDNGDNGDNGDVPDSADNGPAASGDNGTQANSDNNDNNNGNNFP
jgi:hypothetical protein